jgi:hypothetical protein
MLKIFKGSLSRTEKRLMLLKKSQSLTAWFLLVAHINFMVSCSYYRVKTLDHLNNESVTKQIQKKEKYIILHDGEEAWHLKNIVIDNDRQNIIGVIETLPANHQYYKTAEPRPKTNPYHYRDWEPHYKDKPIYEIHIYTNKNIESLTSEVSIPFITITKVEVYDIHPETILYGISITAGAIAGVMVIIGVIAILTKSSCPFVYISDGKTYHFTGEMYGGAIYPLLQRDDYMPLQNFRPINDVYSLKISNELLEKQYTNLANLIVVDHPENSNVIIDKNGNIQTITGAQLPISALSDKNIDFKEQVSVKDSGPYSFNEANTEDNAISSLTMSFKRPQNSQIAKLILNAKNSYWLDYVYGKFNEQFGVLYNTFANQQRKESAQKLNQWSMEQQIPLSVYIETKRGWKFVDYFNSIGPLASRDIVMPIDLTDVTGEEIKIKLECGFMFWDVDYAAMDFAANKEITKNILKASSAIDENGKEVSDLLSTTDNKYLVQPEAGNIVTVNYKSVPVKKGRKQTVFLHSRGYYEYIRDYKGIPDISYLKSFEEKRAFTRFAKEWYNAFINNQDIYTASLTQRDED